MGKEQNYNSIFSNCRLKNYLLSTFSIVLIGISVDSPCQCHTLPIFICNLLWLGFCIRMLPAAKRSRGVWCATNVWGMIGVMLSFVPIAKGNAIAINVLQSGNNVWLLLKIKIKNKKKCNNQDSWTVDYLILWGRKRISFPQKIITFCKSFFLLKSAVKQPLV